MNMITQRGISNVAAVVIVLIFVLAVIISINVSNREESADRNAATITTAVVEADSATGAKIIQFDLLEQNQSGQWGKVVIDEVNGDARLTVTLSGTASSVPQPAHVHVGTCDAIGEIASSLVDVVNGVSETSYSLSFDGLVGHVLSFYPLSVNVHKSADESDVYVACGELPSPSPDAAAASVTSTETTNVRYTSAGFVPAEVKIHKGQKVRFINETQIPFSVASNPHPVHTKLPQFDQTKSNFVGRTIFEFNFTETGSWDYHNHMNSAHGGVIIVE